MREPGQGECSRSCGTAKVGKNLTAAKGSWSPSSVTATYQWLRDGKAIKGATAAKYKLVAADAGKPGTWKPKGVKLSYQWLRGGKSIKGATKSTYKVVKADVGKKLSVKVTGKKSGYKAVSKTSSAKTAKK
ncbi:MAG TPA: hypothetical protein PKA93_07925 [Arachnia sp.]|nr:hypothetical protein [Arachnia sp.]